MLPDVYAHASNPAAEELLLRLMPQGDSKSWGAMAAAPFGSALILPISYAYIALMGSQGLTNVSRGATD